MHFYNVLDLLQEPVEPVAVAPAVVENAQPVAETTETAPLVQKQEDDANASVGASIINMTNNVLGSGLVALAYAVRNVNILLFVDRSALSSLVY